jgi:uracil-DNA glycosylase
MSDSASSPHLANAYEAKTSHEAAQLARRSKRAGLPQPFGNPLSGVMLVVESSAGTADSKMVDALRRSLATVKLDEAYVTWSSPDLREEILSLEPAVLVAVGPTAAHAIDASDYPLARTGFWEAPEGSWFAWTRGTFGLRLPALAPALADADAKRRFWRAFLALRALADKTPSY